jgi:hypothetical protein
MAVQPPLAPHTQAPAFRAGVWCCGMQAHRRRCWPCDCILLRLQSTTSALALLPLYSSTPARSCTLASHLSGHCHALFVPRPPLPFLTAPSCSSSLTPQSLPPALQVSGAALHWHTTLAGGPARALPPVPRLLCVQGMPGHPGTCRYEWGDTSLAAIP